MVLLEKLLLPPQVQSAPQRYVHPKPVRRVQRLRCPLTLKLLLPDRYINEPPSQKRLCVPQLKNLPHLKYTL